MLDVRRAESGPATTLCQQVERTICAEDNCRLVEGEPQCQEFIVENTIDLPGMYIFFLSLSSQTFFIYP